MTSHEGASSDYDILPVDQLLRLSQTDITHDPLQGLEIATTAYEKADNPIDRGVAARQAGFRATQADRDNETVRAWFNASRSALNGDDPASQRELIATELLDGRRQALSTQRFGTADTTSASASRAFERGERTLQSLHVRGSRWDRYGTMLSRHYATHEAMNGDTEFALRTSLKGIWRAVRAERENTPQEHATFVAKQVVTNAAAGLLAVTAPLVESDKIAAARGKIALKLLG